MPRILIALLLLAPGHPALARPPVLSPALQRTLVRTVRQHNHQVKTGKPVMDLGLVFRLVGRTLERTGGDQAAAGRMARRAARWTAGRPRSVRPPRLSSRTVRALRLACQLHRNQLRKGSSVPYLAHLLGVAGIVMRSGGSEREVMAALLHDAVEDQGGARTLKRIRRRCGRDVARIVSEATETPGPWLQRKQHKIDAIATGRISPAGLRVKLADCLHNSGTMTKGAGREGEAFWRVFRGKKNGSLWYYDSMVLAFDRATVGRPGLRQLAGKLAQQVKRLHRAAGQ